MNDEYDVRKAFEEMELELIASMKRNLQRHLDWEEKEKFNWNMWQVEQLKTLENFKKENQQIFNKKFSSINAEIANFLQSSFETSGFEEEKKILQGLAKGLFVNVNRQKGIDSSFFSLNKDKMNALIRATTSDLEKAEYAMLRMTNDQYRKIIFNAQVMANSGSFTLAQSVDKASKDFLRSGINCIQYKDGRRVNIASYAEMSIRTANKRAVLISEGDVRNNYGIHTIRISKYGGCSETCLPWQGRIYVDDVYSGGTKEEAQEKNLTLLSEAIAGGLFHPNCKHRATTYFYDLKKSLGKLVDNGVENPPKEQEHRKNQLHIQQQKRIEAGSLDPDNIKQAQIRKEQWEKKDKQVYESDLGSFRKQLVSQNIDEDYRKVLQERFSHGSKNVKNIYIKYVGDDTIDLLDYADVPCYNRSSKKISLNASMDIRNDRGAGVTWFHEHGHLIDDVLGNISDDEKFKELLFDDVFKYRKNYGRKNKLGTWDKVDAAISKDLNDMHFHSGVSDLLNAISEGNISGIAGHDKTYWQQDSWKRASVSS